MHLIWRPYYGTLFNFAKIDPQGQISAVEISAKAIHNQARTSLHNLLIILPFANLPPKDHVNLFWSMDLVWAAPNYLQSRFCKEHTIVPYNTTGVTINLSESCNNGFTVACLKFIKLWAVDYSGYNLQMNNTLIYMWWSKHYHNMLLNTFLLNSGHVWW